MKRDTPNSNGISLCFFLGDIRDNLELISGFTCSRDKPRTCAYVNCKALYEVPLDQGHHDDLWHLGHLDHPVKHKHSTCWKPKLSNKQKQKPEKPKHFFLVPESVFRNQWVSCPYLSTGVIKRSTYLSVVIHKNRFKTRCDCFLEPRMHTT